MLFFLLFTSSFVVESLVHDLSDLYQSELLDFEGDTDSEEDSKKEKEKENKILSDLSMLISQNTQLIYLGHVILTGPNEEIQEVLSPPPELA